ncbi:MAG: histidinol-phosphate transaminase [Magnetococcales bacterium]|nr:histidinol-phosphate transaminase [Magnetococcales bacterium]
MTIRQWVRPNVLQMAGYTPGEQPQGKPVVKLNTNENPFPPPQPVLDALKAAVDGKLRLYPEPSARPVRQAAGMLYGIDPDQVVAGNGSDDLLTMILRTFVDPGEVVAAPDPTYTLYDPLTTLQGGQFHTVPWKADNTIPVSALVALNPKVIFITRPNAPTGHATPLSEVVRLCKSTKGVVVLDEAYGDFANNSGLPLLANHDNLIITRTFSKSGALAGMRIGLGFMSRDIALQMHKVRDSYNLDKLAQVAAVAALENWDAYEPLIQAIRQQRNHLRNQLNRRGFQVPESQANFLLAQVPQGRRSGKEWLDDLKSAGYLIRYFGADPRLTDKIRITIGTEAEMTGFLQAVDKLLTDN